MHSAPSRTRFFSLNAIPSSFTAGTTRIAETFLLYRLSYGPTVMEPAGFEPATRVVPTAFVQASLPQISIDSITDIQCSPASLPDPNSEMVSKTWSEKPPTLRMSSRSAACVVP